MKRRTKSLSPSPVSKVPLRPKRRRLVVATKTYQHILKRPRDLRDPRRPESTIISNARSFDALVKGSNVFADKSDFIRAILDGSRPQIVFALPPGCGKTMLLSMVSLFVDDQCHREQQKVFRQTFDQGRQFAVMADPQFVQEHMGRYPTLFIDFASICSDTASDIEEQIGGAIQDLFNEPALVEWMKKTDCDVDEADSNLFRRYRLAETLSKKCWFKDNYDSPLVEFGYAETNVRGQIRKIGELIKHFVERCLFVLPHTQCVLVAGVYKFCLDTTKAYTVSMENDLSDGKANSPNSPNFTKYFGFKQEEVEELCDSYGVGEQLRVLAKDYYNGLTVSQVPLYSTWSIMSMLEATKRAGQNPLCVHFNQTPLFKHFNKLFKKDAFVETIMELFENGGKQVDKPQTKFTLDNLIDLHTHTDSENTSPLKEDAAQLMLRLLNASGYLVRDDQNLCVPNEEFRVLLTELVLNNYAYMTKYKFPPKWLNAITEELHRIASDQEYPDDGSELRQKLAEFLDEVALNHKDTNEAYLQTFVGMAALRTRHWTRCALDKRMGCDDKRYSGKRPDVVFSSDKKLFAVCIELKWNSNEEPFYQIWKNHYLTKSPVFETKGALQYVVAIGIDVECKATGHHRVGVRLERMSAKQGEGTKELMGRLEGKLKNKYPEKNSK